MYKPLPKNLTLGESEIHDIGLFARENIKRDYQCGISHIQVGKELYRTPLGGFINHSDKPNCIKTMSLKTVKLPDKEKGPKYVVWNLSTTRDIESGEELTITYTFYKI
jgi:SET domain-containing protein